MATEMWELTQKVPPADNPQTLRARSEPLARTYCDAGRVDEAIKLLEETVQRQREVEGPQHRQTLTRCTTSLLPTPQGSLIEPWRSSRRRCRGGRRAGTRAPRHA